MSDATDQIVIVANPVSGRGKGRRMAERLVLALREREIDAAVSWTTGRGDGERLTADALAAGARTIVACGGDGTMQEVAHVLAGSGVRMGLMPAGRCNDFARALELPGDPDRIAAGLAGGAIRMVDLGRAGGRHYCTVAALGFDAAVSRFVDGQMRLPLKGTPAYLYGTLRVLMGYRPVEVRMTGDFGTYDGPIFLVANANTSSYGGAIQIAPEARPDDGVLDICLIRPASRLRILRLLPRTMRGVHGSVPEVRFLRTKSVRIESAEPTEVWADGEPLGHTPLTIEVIPAALRVVALPEPPEG